MSVKILNPDVLSSLYKNHGEFACTCYDTDKKYAEKVGESCVNSGHMSGSRCEYIKFEIYGDRGAMEQIMRHEIGVRHDEIDKYAYSDRIETVIDVNPSDIVKNMQSFRYVDKNEFGFTTPRSILDNKSANELYQWLMRTIDETRMEIRDILVGSGTEVHKAVEDANFTLPRATCLTLTIAFTPEALIHFMHKRLCNRAQDEIHTIAIEMKNKVREINPKFSEELVPHCKYLLWCPEGSKCCGAMPTRKELERKLS